MSLLFRSPFFLGDLAAQPVDSHLHTGKRLAQLVVYLKSDPFLLRFSDRCEDDWTTPEASSREWAISSVAIR
jgi:hypothetical protein